MRNSRTIDRIDALFNRIQRVRDGRIVRRLADTAFVIKHFPYHETVARKETAGLAALQSFLMMEYAA